MLAFAALGPAQVGRQGSYVQTIHTPEGVEQETPWSTETHTVGPCRLYVLTWCELTRVSTREKYVGR